MNKIIKVLVHKGKLLAFAEDGQVFTPSYNEDGLIIDWLADSRIPI